MHKYKQIYINFEFYILYICREYITNKLYLIICKKDAHFNNTYNEKNKEKKDKLNRKKWQKTHKKFSKMIFKSLNTLKDILQQP